MSRIFSKALKLIALFLANAFLILVVFFIAIKSAPVVKDSIVAYNYEPSEEVAKLTSRLELTGKGQRIFYATRPSLSATNQAAEKCGGTEKAVATLGCYYNDNIYIYDVKNKELDGVEEVTASHEILHASYHRLDYTERKRVNSLIEKQLKSLRQDKVFQDRMKVYNDLAWTDKLDEFHSVIGTEVEKISPELEEYYSQYFKNRLAIVAMHKKYSQVFFSLESEAKQLEKSINQLADNINKRVKQYNSDIASLNLSIKDFNRRANSGYFKSQSQFDNERTSLVRRSKNLESEYNEIKALEKRFNDKKSRYENVYQHLNKLNISINSNLAQPTKVNDGQE